jgi:hypothetical protein
MRFPADLAVTIPRRWAWALGIGIALLVGLLGWLLIAGRAAAPLATQTVHSAVAAVERRVLGSVPFRPAPPVARTTDRGSAHGVDEYEVCGGTWVKANADGNVDDKVLKGPMRRDDAARAVDRALAADPRPVAHAARLILQMADGDDDRRLALMASSLGCGAEPCPAALAASAAAVDAVTAARESLARFAATTPDPAAYALAYRMCGSGRLRDGACGMLSAEQWARLDPGNAVPWQEVFAAAQARKDSAAANEALHRIATSRRSDQRFFDLPGLVVEAAPQDDGLRNGVFMLAVEAIGIQAAWSLPAYQPLVSACKRDMLRDSNRRQTCEAIAELMAEKSDTLLERGLGGAVGRQLGWPEERVERMRAELQAFANSTYAGIEPREAMGCEAIKRLTDDVRHKARLGEVGAMRDWLAHEAPPADELLRRYRTAQRELAEQGKATAAAQAASGASAPG